jgi:hypothetical protein
MKVASRLLVIDTDIARACGGSDRPPAPHCLSTLNAVLTICHRILLSEDLNAEWQRHAGRNRAFMRWLRQMFGRKKVRRVTLSDTSELAGKLVQEGASDEERKQIAKDVHLLTTALQGDLRILSMDDRARRRYSQAAASITRIASICWVNPAKEDEQAIPWLEAGAPADPHRQLGNSS